MKLLCIRKLEFSMGLLEAKDAELLNSKGNASNSITNRQSILRKSYSCPILQPFCTRNRAE